MEKGGRRRKEGVVLCENSLWEKSPFPSSLWSGMSASRCWQKEGDSSTKAGSSHSCGGRAGMKSTGRSHLTRDFISGKSHPEQQGNGHRHPLKGRERIPMPQETRREGCLPCGPKGMGHS